MSTAVIYCPFRSSSLVSPQALCEVLWGVAVELPCPHGEPENPFFLVRFHVSGREGSSYQLG